MSESSSLVHNEADRFYELFVGDKPAGLLIYEGNAERKVFTHAFMNDGFRGRGLVRTLIRESLDDTRAHHGTITNYCPVVGHFIERHPEYAELVDADVPGSW